MSIPDRLVCTRCKVEKPRAEFHRASSKAAKHGAQMPCKACQRGSRAETQARWRASNPEKQKAMQDAWLAKNPDYERERSKRRYHEEPAYRERTRAAAKAWAKEHPEYYRAAAKLRRARLRGVECTLTQVEAKELFEEYAGLCAYCLTRATTLDHVVALASGGAHSKTNLVPACKTCNSSKNDRPLLVWLSERKVA